MSKRETKETVIKIVDAPTGKGKTTALIEHIKENYNDFTQDKKRFIVVTPYKKEITRLKEAIKDFVEVFEPQGKKSADFINIISSQNNVITTHSLFDMITYDLIEAIKNSPISYELYIDEEPQVLNKTFSLGTNWSPKREGLELLGSLSKDDFEIMQERNIIKVDKSTELVSWNPDASYKGIFTFLEHLCKAYDIYYHKPENNKTPTLIVLTKKDVWEVFESVTVLTYRAKYSTFGYYCEFNNLKTMYFHVENNKFIEGYKDEYPKGLERFEFDTSLNLPNSSLSKSWYKNNMDKEDFKTLKKKQRTFIRKVKDNNASCIWSTFKTYKDRLKGKEVAEKFYLACNVKATNEYRDATAVSYLCNRYMNPIIIQYLRRQDIDVNQEEWALSELIQFVWRSNIREIDSNKTITLFIPSARMRELFKNWLAKGLGQNFATSCS